MSDPAAVLRFVCSACSQAHAKWSPFCLGCKSKKGLDPVSAEAIAKKPSDPVWQTEPSESSPEPERSRPRLVIARSPSPEPDLEDPAEELADVVSGTGTSMPVPISEVSQTAYNRDTTGLAPLDAVLGGGIVPGSVIVIGGEPGCGKSSLVMQAIAGIQLRCLYTTGEETAEQAAGNARRIGAASNKIYIVAENDLTVVLSHARTVRAQILVVDSIQTLVCADLSSSAGSPGQVRECAVRLVRFAKTTGTSVILVGHVTNDGSLAGPKTLKHLVDVVLELEAGSRPDGAERLLKCAGKNRFGPSNVTGRFELTAEGLTAVDGDGWNEEL